MQWDVYQHYSHISIQNINKFEWGTKWARYRGMAPSPPFGSASAHALLKGVISKSSMTWSIARPLCNSWVSCLASAAFSVPSLRRIVQTWQLKGHKTIAGNRTRGSNLATVYDTLVACSRRFFTILLNSKLPQSPIKKSISVMPHRSIWLIWSSGTLHAELYNVCFCQPSVRSSPESWSLVCFS